MNRRAISGHVLRSATFGCVPVSDDERTRAHLVDLCDALGKALELPIRSHRAPSAGALASAFHAGRVHLAWVSAAAAAVDPSLTDATPLVRSVRDGLARYHGVIFARRSGAIRTLRQLSRATMAWVAPTSAAGYLFPRAALRGQGIEPDGVLGSQSFLGSHGAVADAVASGAADVGATFAVFEGGDPERPMTRAGFGEDEEAMREFRVLLTTRAIPSDVVVASAELLSTLQTDPVKALSEIHEAPAAVAAMRHVLGADRFEAADVRAIEALRAQLPVAETSAAG